MIELNGGIRFGESIALDPTRIQPSAVVSHAHSDHLKRHKTIYASQPTLDFSKLSVGEFKGIPLKYGKTYRFDGCVMRTEPAGHILGSAQCIVDYMGCRTVYTGDFKLSPNDTCAPAEIHECDILFIDTTFGKKIFEFPDYSYIKQRLLEFVEASIYNGYIPIVFAYNLGKAQEAMKILGDAGYHTYASSQACAYADIHCNHGVDIVNYSLLDDKYPENGAIILPPSYKLYNELFPKYKKRTCFISGWALHRGYIHTRYFDEYIPLSDHASYSDLIRYVETAKPDKIYCLFGFGDIVEDLKHSGFNAVKVTMANRKGIDRYVLKQPGLFNRRIE
ncbi:MAG: hypothetical protein J7K40_04320 [candidate division Zixibacteria bacterium]|nr:hypothetical protein [candidate division Zixibacteria bacterium]